MQQDRDQERGTEASPLALVSEAMASAFEDVRASFERFCLAAGIEAMEALLEDEATSICGRRHGRDAERAVYRWGTTMSPVGFHGGKVGVRRPRLRGKEGGEVPLASFVDLQRGDLLQAWAYELMLLGVATRRSRRAVRLEAGDVPRQAGDGTSKSAVSRRFVAMSRTKLEEWLARDLSDLDLVVVQIDGMMVADHTLIVALGIKAQIQQISLTSDKRPKG